MLFGTQLQRELGPWRIIFYKTRNSSSQKLFFINRIFKTRLIIISAELKKKCPKYLFLQQTDS